MRRRITMAVATGAVLVLGLAACGGGDDGDAPGGDETTAAPTATVGIAMPTKTSERWIRDGDALVAELEELGYEADLNFADDDVELQLEQIDAMIEADVDAIVVAAIDGTSLGEQLEAAEAAGIPVIAYDRLLRDTGDLDFYVTFDNYAVGVAQAKALLAGLGLVDWAGVPTDTAPTGPLNVELFAGSLDDNNAFFFWQGAIDTLEPYFEDGTLVVKSGQTEIEQTAILRWSEDGAKARMDELLAAHYSDGSEIAAVLSPYDGISRGIITSLQEAGMGPTLADGLPVVTGQDAEAASVLLMQEGVQSSTVFKDTRRLAHFAALAVESYVNGEEPEPNDTTSYDNGVEVVPAYLLDVESVYLEDITTQLLDSGYLTQEQIDAGSAG
ncbi:sugar-binding protein [Cellulomonas sp. SLBN-39]|uniref:substrate-binding domain-containing protein n=1 Tax=Cellulomonas sp. SLBN-39 TaxID=2768446 RepID=UPI0011520EFF|nr:sugar-binding protein [Cellulomonas sp. SLBN-39]TQL03484.1 putative multiple sugar transport system substrate-binding protein [Cellulomonas sp. SLBN-39]